MYIYYITDVIILYGGVINFVVHENGYITLYTSAAAAAAVLRA